MNARKIAWQMLHAEVRRRIGPAHTGPDLDPELENFRLLHNQARDAGISSSDIMLELAGVRGDVCPDDPNDPLGVAQQISRSVLAEPDEEGNVMADQDLDTVRIAVGLRLTHRRPGQCADKSDRRAGGRGTPPTTF